LAKAAKRAGKEASEGVIEIYSHAEGRLAVMVEVNCETEAKIATARAKEDGKPDKIVPKIVEGYLKKYKEETVLMNQAYVRDGSMTVQDLINEQVVKLEDD